MAMRHWDAGGDNQQLLYLGPGRLAWRPAPEPALSLATDAIVRPIAVARCDGDKVFLLHRYGELMRAGLKLRCLDPALGTLFGNQPFQPPFAVGHECVAEVLAVGAEVGRVRRGDQVVVPFSIACGNCGPCGLQLTSKCQQAGETSLSAYGFGSGTGPWGGMLSDRLRVPFADFMLQPLPAGVQPQQVASASDNIPDAWRCVAPYLKARPGASVLVMGGGAASIGLYAVALAKALGSERVTYIDHKLERQALASALGAEVIELPKSGRSRWLARHAPVGGGEYPISLDASSRAAGLRFALRSLSPGGTCTGAGYYVTKGTALPLMQMYHNDSTLKIGVAHPHPVLPELLQLVASGRFKPEQVTTLVADWQDAPEALLSDTTKVVLSRPPLMRPTGWGKPA